MTDVNELLVMCRDMKHSIWMYRQFVLRLNCDKVKTNSHIRELRFADGRSIRFISEEKAFEVLKGRHDVTVVSAKRFMHIMETQYGWKGA